MSVNVLSFVYQKLVAPLAAASRVATCIVLLCS